MKWIQTEHGRWHCSSPEDSPVPWSAYIVCTLEGKWSFFVVGITISRQGHVYASVEEAKVGAEKAIIAALQKSLALASNPLEALIRIKLKKAEEIWLQQHVMYYTGGVPTPEMEEFAAYSKAIKLRDALAGVIALDLMINTLELMSTLTPSQRVELDTSSSALLDYDGVNWVPTVERTPTALVARGIVRGIMVPKNRMAEVKRCLQELDIEFPRAVEARLEKALLSYEA